MKFALIGGTGVQQLPGLVVRHEHQTETGISLYEGELVGHPVLLLPRHGKGHKVPPHAIPHVLHIRTLQQMGVQAVFATAAVGSLRTDWKPGTLVVLSDFLDFMREVHTLYTDTVVHTDFSEPFSARLREALLQSAQAQGIEVKPEGVYVCAPGPRYETPAEIRMFRMLGGDVIGMTVVPEAVLCREAGIEYAAVAVVTNLGTGLSDQSLAHHEVEAVMRHATSLLARLFAGAVAHLRSSSLP